MKRGLLFILILFLFFNASSQFTPGNIVVSRVGDGATTLSSASARVQLVEYTLAGTPTGVIASLPIVSGGPGNRACTNSGSATTEGGLAQSYDGKYLVHAGYDAAPGLASVATTASDPNRTLALIDLNGTVNTSTSFLATPGNAYIRNSIRSVCSYDGTQFWASGAGNTGSGGVRYLSIGNDGVAGTQLNSTFTNTRNVAIFDDQLYVSSGASTIRVATVGTGLPTTTGQGIVNLPNVPNSVTTPTAFILFDRNAAIAGVDLLYFVSQTTNAGEFGLFKYSFDGTNWNSQGKLADATTNNSQASGLTGYVNCNGNVVLYLTRAVDATSLPTEIRTYTDLAAYNATMTSNGTSILGASTLLVTAGSNYAFRGITMSPAQGYTVTSAQNISSGSYNVITVENNGIATLTGDIVVYDRIVVKPGGTLIMGTNTISSPTGIASTFEVKNGGTVKIGSPYGIAASTTGPTGGNVQTCIRKFSSFGIYEYNGTIEQITGDGLPTTISGTLKINNTAGISSLGVTLTNPVTVGGALDLTLGKLRSSSSALISISSGGTIQNYSASSFIGGPLKVTGHVGFTFPIGINAATAPTGTIYAPLVMNHWAGSPAITDSYTAEYIRGNPQSSIGSNIETPINHVSFVEYWSLFRTDGGTNVSQKQIILEVNPESICYHLNTLLVARYDQPTSKWKSEGYSGSYLDPASTFPLQWGHVFSNSNVTTFGYFTLSTTEAFADNPLPITLIAFDATKLSSSQSSINWELAACCSADAKFEVQRAGTDKAFTTIGTTAGSTTNKSYTWLDNSLLTGINYYRLKMIDETGKVSYSRTVAIMNGVKGLLLTSLVPTVVTNTATLTIASSARQPLDIIIVDMQGRIIKKQHLTVDAGNTNIELPLSGLARGIYHLQGISPDGKTNTIRFIR